MAERDQRKEVANLRGEPQPNHIGLWVTHLHSEFQRYFIVRRGFPLRELMDMMDHFCADMKLARGTLKFQYKGRHLTKDDIPENHGMENGDNLDVYGEGEPESRTVAVPERKK